MLQTRPSSRIILNTGAQYNRSIINIIVGLYSARLILAALGVEDFGIYALVASVISLLLFLSNSLAVTTQRFISFNQTSSVTEFKRKQIFSNSLAIHLTISVILIVFLEVVGLFLFDGFLNIAESRIHSAKIVYQCVIFMELCTLLSSPFKALLIAYEKNIGFVSTSLNNAYSPQIMKLAGENRMAEMFSLEQKYCKYSFLQSIIIVPLFFFCPIILGVWLEKVPQYSVIFCRMIILTSLADLLTVGLNTCIQATGRIKYNSLSLNSLKLMTIPVIEQSYIKTKLQLRLCRPKY